MKTKIGKSILLAFFFISVCLIDVSDVKAELVSVSLDGTGDYSSIQQAIDSATIGDTILVSAGVYNETIIVDIDLTLIGEDKNTTIIDSKNELYSVIISSKNVSISGFTILNSTIGMYVAGIIGDACITISHNRYTNNDNGLYLYNVTNVSINNNDFFYNDGDGIFLYNSDDCSLEENNIMGHNNNGISLLDSSSNNIISNNILYNNRNGIEIGRWSDGNTVTHNTMTNNENIGVSIAFSSYNMINGNAIIKHNIGVKISDTSNNNISSNNFTSNIHGIYLYDADENTIDDNNVFIDNDEDISTGSKTLKTPGFEFFTFLCTISLLYILHHKKNNLL